MCCPPYHIARGTPLQLALSLQGEGWEGAAAPHGNQNASAVIGRTVSAFALTGAIRAMAGGTRASAK